MERLLCFTFRCWSPCTVCCIDFWVFLPGFPWSNWKSLPEQDIGNLTWSIRKCARVLWTVSLTFQNGLDEEMVETLKQHYPEGLMAKLKVDSCDAFEVSKTAVNHTLQFSKGWSMLFGNANSSWFWIQKWFQISVHWWLQVRSAMCAPSRVVNWDIVCDILQSTHVDTLS